MRLIRYLTFFAISTATVECGITLATPPLSSPSPEPIILLQPTKKHGGVLRVPKEELEKAFQELEKSFPSSFVDVEAEQNDAEDAEDDLLNAYASPPKKPKPNPAKTKPSAGSGSQKVVELAVVADAKMCSNWEARYPGQGIPKLKAFIHSLIINTNAIYRHSSLSPTISFTLVHLELLKVQPKTLNPSGGDAEAYLKSFCTYAGDKNENGRSWDHALLLTGYDTTSGGDPAVAGLAWFQTMCLRYYSCSLNEANSFSSAYTVAHELGHSLGMEHDGEGVNGKCSPSTYIMSPTTGAAKTTWSTCSAKNLQDFLATGSSEGAKDASKVPVCLGKSSKKHAKLINKMPGAVFGLNEQCALECGQCSPVIIKSVEEVCSMLYCDIGGGKAQRIHPALEGSPCGEGKQCRSGSCVKL